MRLSSATASLLAFARGTPRKAGDKQKRGPFFFHTLLFFSLALLASFIKFLLVPLASSTHAFPTGTAPPRNRPHYHGFAPQSDGVFIPITRLFIIFFSLSLSLSRMSFFFVVVFIPLPPGCLFLGLWFVGPETITCFDLKMISSCGMRFPLALLRPRTAPLLHSGPCFGPTQDDCIKPYGISVSFPFKAH